MNREHAKRILEDVTFVLESYGMTHFLVDGTLLGAIRDGDFIEHDTDIDIGVMAEQWTPFMLGLVLDSLSTHGFGLVHVLGELDKYFEVSVRRDGIKCDLFYYRREGDKRIFHAFRNGGRNLPEDVITYEYPAELIEKLRFETFNGYPYPIPSNPEKVLALKYGATWRTPVKKWDWADGPKNKRHE